MHPVKAWPMVAVAVLALLPACGSPASFALRVAPIAERSSAAPPVEGNTAWVEVAADPEARERGLMGRLELAEDCGMLFVYPEARRRQFWMKDCYIPLSAAFLDDGARVLRVVEMAPGAGVAPERLPRFDSGGPARYVLEMGPGWFSRRGIVPGTVLDLEPALKGVVAR